MVGGRLRCLSCCFTLSQLLFLVLLLWVCFHDVEASSCDHTVQKQVGDTVELSSCLSPDDDDKVSAASWRFHNILIAVMNEVDISENTKFSSRLKINLKNFSLTVSELTLQDSGTFKFASEVNDQQRETVSIRLQVHEPFTPPDLRVNSTWLPSNESCTVSLECVSTSDSEVNYAWTVRNQTISGSRLQFTVRRQDGVTEFTCTISNNVSKRSASKTVTCDGDTSESSDPNMNKQIIILVAGGVFIIIIGLVAIICVCLCKQRTAGSDSDDLTVYADITDVAGTKECAHSNVQRTSMNCSLYETVADPANAVKPGPNTVYDQIQLGRMRKAPGSIGQDPQGIKTKM